MVGVLFALVSNTGLAKILLRKLLFNGVTPQLPTVRTKFKIQIPLIFTPMLLLPVPLTICPLVFRAHLKS